MAESKGKVGSLFYGMTLDTKEFKKRLKSVRKTTKTIGKEITDTFKTIAKGGTIIGAGLGAGAAAMMLFTKASIDAIKAQVILAESIGSTQGEIAGLELFTKNMGVETQMVIDKMREFGGMDQFKKMAEQVKNAGDEQAQLNKSIELFGNEGTKMLPILQQGAAGFAKMEKEAIALGLALSPKQVEESRIVWEELEDTWNNIKGISTQVAQALKVPLGLLSAATRGFIKAFKSEILGGFESLGVTMTNFMKGTIDLFVRYGVPFINGFINGAAQIGEAFSTLFSWLTPAGDKAFGGLSDFFVKTIDFLATIKDSLVFGIAKTLEHIVTGLFKAAHAFIGVMEDMVLTAILAMEKVGLVDDQAAVDFLKESRKTAFDTHMAGQEIIKSLKIVQDDSFGGMVKTIEKQIDKNKKMTSIIMGSIGEFTMKLGKVEEEAAAKTADIVAKAAVGVSKQMIGMISSGSQEEQNILNRKQDKNLILQQKQLKAQQETAKAVMRWDVY